MANYNNIKRQLIGYSENMAESFDRLKKHLSVSSFVDVAAVQGVTRRLGQKDMSLVHVAASIEKARQTGIIADCLLHGLSLERKFLMKQSEVFSLVLRATANLRAILI